MPTITCVEVFRQLYQRRVPKVFYDYAESESCKDSMCLRNETTFE